MRRALEIEALVIGLCLIAFGGFLTWRISKSLSGLDASIAQVTATARRVNGDAGTITMLNKDLGATKSLIVHADLVARHEQQQLGVLDAQERQIAADVHQTMTNLSGAASALAGTAHSASATIQTAQTTIQGLQPVLVSANAAVAKLGGSADSVTRFMQSRELAATLSNVRGTTANLDASTRDFEVKFHAFLFPAKCKTLGCKMKRNVWPIIKGISAISPSIYWGEKAAQLQ